jgi:hypothetical protein
LDLREGGLGVGRLVEISLMDAYGLGNSKAPIS